mgnify:CR=1 FL=1
MPIRPAEGIVLQPSGIYSPRCRSPPGFSGSRLASCAGLPAREDPAGKKPGDPERGIRASRHVDTVRA